MQIANALRSEALPALEHLTGNSGHTLRRFDRDEPPPYVSSTEDEDEDMYHPALGPVDSAMSDELNRLLDKPLNDDQRHSSARRLESQSRAYDPGARYDKEVKLERERIKMWANTANTSMRTYFIQFGPAKKGRAGRECVNIIARRNIKRRWQKLGVWNPGWGIPGRANNLQPNDETDTWKWRWQHGAAAAEWRCGPKVMSLNPQHPITHAFRLRQGMRQSEHSPMPPRSSLGEDAPASQAESFIISRPWFVFDVEASEEVERYSGMPMKARRPYKGSMAASARERWKERGDLKAHWRDPGGDILIGWKWRHESPSPEPEDLSGLDDLATFDLNPSEVDALEAIPPPSPPTPRPVYMPPANPGTGIISPVEILQNPRQQHQRMPSSSHHNRGADADAGSHLLNPSVAAQGSLL